MITAEVIKGLDENPKVLGIRGNLVMPFVGVSVLVLVLCFVAMVNFFFKKQIAQGFFFVGVAFVGVILVALVFRFFSRDKEFTKIENNPDIISNQDLLDILN